MKHLFSFLLIFFLFQISYSKEICLVNASAKSDSLKLTPFKLKNTVFIEAGGASLGGFNYERFFSDNFRFNLSGRIGAMHFPKIADLATPWITIGFNIYYRIGNSTKHHVMYSPGVSLNPYYNKTPFATQKKWSTSYFLTQQIGYQFFSKNEKYTFSINAGLLWEDGFITGANSLKNERQRQNRNITFTQHYIETVYLIPGIRFGYRF